MEQTNTDAGMPAKLPGFLKVLCILTFVGVGISIIASVMGYFAMQAAGLIMGGAESSATDMGSMPGMDKAMEAANAAVNNAGLILGVGILGAILCLMGAIMMWKRKKMGFYIYTVGEIAPPIISMVVLGMSGLGAFGIFGFIIPIAFIIMYALNLKHLS